MAISTNDAIVKLGTQKTLEANGASVATGGIVQANDASYSIATDGSSAPDAIFALSAGFAAYTSIENKTMDLYARALNVDGTNDVLAPTATFTHRYVGSFRLSAAAAVQYCELTAEAVPLEADYYIINSSGQTLSAGWTLKVTPKTIGPAA